MNSSPPKNRLHIAWVSPISAHDSLAALCSQNLVPQLSRYLDLEIYEPKSDSFPTFDTAGDIAGLEISPLPHFFERYQTQAFDVVIVHLDEVSIHDPLVFRLLSLGAVGVVYSKTVLEELHKFKHTYFKHTYRSAQACFVTLLPSMSSEIKKLFETSTVFTTTLPFAALPEAITKRNRGNIRTEFGLTDADLVIGIRSKADVGIMQSLLEALVKRLKKEPCESSLPNIVWSVDSYLERERLKNMLAQCAEQHSGQASDLEKTFRIVQSRSADAIACLSDVAFIPPLSSWKSLPALAVSALTMGVPLCISELGTGADFPKDSVCHIPSECHIGDWLLRAADEVHTNADFSVALRFNARLYVELVHHPRLVVLDLLNIIECIITVTADSAKDFQNLAYAAEKFRRWYVGTLPYRVPEVFPDSSPEIAHKWGALSAQYLRSALVGLFGEIPD